MDPQIAAMVLLSAALHPLWNAMVKSDAAPEAAYVTLEIVYALIALLHILYGAASLADALEVWPYILISWIGQMVYGGCLLGVMRIGDMAAFYPVVRATPIVIAAYNMIVLGHRYSPLIMVGIALVVVGVFLLHYRPGQSLLDKPKALLLSVLSLSGTAVFAISDSLAVQRVEAPVMMLWTEVLSIPSYVILFRCLGRLDSVWHPVSALIRRPLRYAAIGLISYASYFLILKAYEFGGDVATVSAVRQAALPLSVIIGWLYLKERSAGQRFSASAILAFGIAIVLFS